MYSRWSAALSPLAALAGALLLVAALPTGARANRSDCFIDIPLLGFGSENTPGGPTGTESCRIDLPSVGSATPTFNGTAYLDAQHSYRTIQTPVMSPLPTELPTQGTLLELGLDQAVLDSSGATGAAGIENIQPFFGTRSAGSGNASGFVEVSADFTIMLNADAASLWQGGFGVNLATPAGFDSFFVLVDSDGNQSGDPGFSIVDLGNNLYQVTGLLQSDSFTLPTDGTPFEYRITAFGEVTVQPRGLTAISTGNAVVDSSNTVTSRVVSFDPDASFVLGNPLASPEPALLALLGAAAGAVALLQRRRR